MGPANFLDLTFAMRLTTALTHFLWQGTLIVMLALIGEHLLRTAAARWRYLLHLSALTAMALCLPCTMFLVADRPLVKQSDLSAPLIAPPASKTTAVPQVRPVAKLNAAQLTHAATDAHVAGADGLDSEPAVAGSASIADVGPASPVSTAMAETGREDGARLWAPWVALVYLVGAAAFLLRMAWGIWSGYRLRCSAEIVTDESLLALVRRQTTRLGLKTMPLLAWCGKVSTPIVIGILKPIVLLPAAAANGLSAGQLEAILSHELAHIRRYDLFVNLLQRVIESVLFFHPAVWFLSRRLSSERELACDEMVLSAGWEPARYADSLLRMAEIAVILRRPGQAHPVSTLAATGDRPSEFKRRILKIVGLQPSTALQPGRLALLLVAAVALAAANLAVSDDAQPAIDTPNQVAEPRVEKAVRQLNVKPFVAKLPGGGTVELVGLATNESDPQQWWRPNGIRRDKILEHSDLLATVGDQPMRKVVLQVEGVTSPQDIATPGLIAQRTVLAEEENRSIVRVEGAFIIPTGKKAGKITVGIATQPQSALRVLDPTGVKVPPPADAPRDALVEDIQIESVNGARSINRDRPEQTWITWISPVAGDRQVDVDMKLIDTDGKSHDRKQLHTSGDSLPHRHVTYEFDIPFARVARFEYRLRVFHEWVTFKNVALNAGDDTQVQVAVESLPKARPAHYVADLPEERSVEFVGITKNTMPANDGWRPDGLPIGDVGKWKSTILLHGGNTSSSFLEDQPHPEPDADAVDFLFQFQGLKSQPSFHFDLPTSGSSYSHLPVQDPYQLRVSGRLRGEAPPGSKWTLPDGIVRIRLTDEPWGKWLQISPKGEVLNPLNADDLYHSYYEMIELVGIEPHKRAPNKLALVLHQPEDGYSLYNFEIRGIGLDGKHQWVLEWEGRGVEGTDLKEGRWGLASPEKEPISHYEFRLRPYEFQVTFENVAVEPGAGTDIKMKVERLTPAPVLTPTADLVVPEPRGPGASPDQDVTEKPPSAAHAARNELLRRYILSGGKISTTQLNAAITLVASEGADDAEFVQKILMEFDQACVEEKDAVKSHLLAVLTQMFEIYGSRRWQQERLARNPEDLPQVALPAAANGGKELRKQEAKMLASVMAQGRKADRSDIDAFVVALRQFHHRDCLPFLRDVLHEASDKNKDPFGGQPPTGKKKETVADPAPPARQGQWDDNIGGTWSEAKFHAAVALAELGDREGVEWLLKNAETNPFGIDVSLFRGAHARDGQGSRRVSCLNSLRDLFGVKADAEYSQLAGWWEKHNADFAPRPVAIKLSIP